ncbi:F-box/WD repeat-containing protein 7 [Hondaea fermentalgiana]|uniref:F-box/WD repeat-containing protein 7 n=1 Tax=Hondaea fermentalgiana TaxID=2315210 RepID=A0A2R5GDX1_9STRA|nr:F-box/WD repeat-containing protein 7 [Hondaea fermentalgiana]|eukprot:GBG29132.1 F-box/WD repeat-containing protein 7 [Hondaea fermentalgiana]
MAKLQRAIEHRVRRAAPRREQHFLQTLYLGENVVSGSTDKPGRILKATSDELQHILFSSNELDVLKVPWVEVTCVAIMGDSFVSGSQEATVCVWDVKSGYCHFPEVNCVANQDKFRDDDIAHLLQHSYCHFSEVNCVASSLGLDTTTLRTCSTRSGKMDEGAALKSGMYKNAEEFYDDGMEFPNDMLMDLIDWTGGPPFHGGVDGTEVGPSAFDHDMAQHDVEKTHSAASVTTGSVSTRSVDTPAHYSSPEYSASASASPMEEMDDLAGADGALERSDVAIARLELDEVFQLLWKGRAGQYVTEIPKRPQASPVARDVPLFYVSPGLKHLLSEAEKDELLGDPDKLVAVKYQGFSNGEIWWSKEHGYRRGLVARNMTRKPRTNQSSDSSSHGFAGRWYTLLERRDASTPVTKTSCRSYVIHGAPSLVQFWPASEGDAQGRADRKGSGDGSSMDDEFVRVSNLKKRRLLQSAISLETGAPGGAPVKTEAKTMMTTGLKRGREDAESHSASFGHTAAPGSHKVATTEQGQYGACPVSRARDSTFNEETLVLNRNVHVQGELTVDGDLTVRSLLVRGNLRLEGQLMTPPHAADYAEWFPCLDPKERIISGQVVQLRSPEQKITLDTSGEGPIMLVSTTPSVAAGVPDPDVHPVRGALCGFLGQLPALVRGPVEAGSHLFPSGDNDGVCVKGDTRHVDREPIGTAMESCGPGVHIVNTFVRWPYNQAWQQKRSASDRAGKVVATCWKISMIYVFYTLCQLLVSSVLWMRGETRVDVHHMILLLEITAFGSSLRYFPVYPEYVTKGDVWKAVFLYSSDFVYSLGMFFARVCVLEDVEQGPVSLTEVRRYMLDTLLWAVHLLMLVLVLHNAFRTRQTLMQLPKESSATRAKWKKAIMKHFYTFM